MHMIENLSPIRPRGTPRPSARAGSLRRLLPLLLSAAASAPIAGFFTVAPAIGSLATSPLTAPAPKISPSFASKFQNVCEGISGSEAKFGRLPYPTFDPTTPQPALLKKVGTFFDKALSVEKSVPGKLRALGEPAAGAATWHKLRSLAERYMKLAEQQAQDATAGDTTGFVAAVKTLTTVLQEFKSVAITGGLSATSPCVTFFG